MVPPNELNSPTNERPARNEIKARCVLKQPFLSYSLTISALVNKPAQNSDFKTILMVLLPNRIIVKQGTSITSYTVLRLINCQFIPTKLNLFPNSDTNNATATGNRNEKPYAAHIIKGKILSK
jgi:hypothetical protein